MQALFEMTDGLAALKKIVEALPPSSIHWNEAQNRFQFIDRLMVECLGWQQPYMKVEQPDGAGGRSDYELGIPPKAILEAKRESKLWDLLPHATPKKVRKIEPLIQSSQTFKEVVDQILPYCARKGAPIAIVCNGPQLAIFQAIVIGEEPLKGECYIFNGFSDYLDNFPLLWTLLSPEGIIENRALRALSEHRNPRLPPKCSTFIPEPNGFRYRDNLQNELREIGSFLLEEIEDNPDLRESFYKECYVPIEANNRHLLLSKKIISKRYSRVSGDNNTPSALDSAASSGKISSSFLRNAGSKPIVVIGDVGVGKTSFFENLFLNLDDKSDSFIININLGIKANLTSDLKEFVLDSIIDSFYDNYDIDLYDSEFVTSVYNDEIKRWSRSYEAVSLKNDPEGFARAKSSFLVEKTKKTDSHLHSSLSHLNKGQGRKIILVIDNADQRTSDVQQEAFLISQELAATRNMFVFVSLRPSTFYQSKMSGTLAAYQNKILTISPPPADLVLEKRLTFALRVAEGKVAPAALDGIRLNLTSIVAYLRATLRSIRVNSNIRQFLSNITGGNTRAVIEMITTFCGSPNVDARKIVNIESENGDYIVPLHEFTKHALLGEYTYFNPASSVVACNVFDVGSADRKEHFLSPLVVSYLSSNIGGRDQDGFVPGEQIHREMARFGFLADQVNGALKKLAAAKLIETPYSHYREVEVSSDTDAGTFNFRATSVGIYHVRFWIGSFSFLDAVSIDTPIMDNDTRASVSERSASLDIKDRYQKSVCFRDYLESQWHIANLNCAYFDFSEVLVANRDSFEHVRRVVERVPPSRAKPFRGGRFGNQSTRA